jgi:putative oxidoreductase
VLELVVLYLGGSLALLLVGPGRFSFDAGMLPGLLVQPSVRIKPETSVPSDGISGLTPVYVPIKASNSNR